MVSTEGYTKINYTMLEGRLFFPQNSLLNNPNQHTENGAAPITLKETTLFKPKIQTKVHPRLLFSNLLFLGLHPTNLNCHNNGSCIFNNIAKYPILFINGLK